MNANDLRNMVKKPYRVRHSYTQSITAPPDEVFPLLCPLRELDWAPGWQPDWVISNSGVAEQGCVFQTPGHDGSAAAVWVITEHDPGAGHVEMIKIIPEHTVMKLEISLEADGQGGTRSTVTYGHTAIGPAGERFVDECTEQWYEQFMQGWEAAMNHYLATGELMK